MCVMGGVAETEYRTAGHLRFYGVRLAAPQPPFGEERPVTQVIALNEQVKALHPDTGKLVTVVGVDTTGGEPRLIILHQTYEGISAEIVDYADLPRPTARD